MEITITGRHHGTDPAIKAYVDEKLQKISRLHDRLLEAHVIIDREHEMHIVEVTVSAPRNHKFNARVEGSDLRATIDAVEHKIEAQIRHWKERLTDHRP